MPASAVTATPAAPSPHTVRGRHGEERALQYLTGQGLTLVTRNFRCRGGEIDLIMWHGRELVFIEVRSRASASHGGAAASVTSRKQARLILAAQVFLQRHRRLPPCRIDVIAIDGSGLKWLTGAVSL